MSNSSQCTKYSYVLTAAGPKILPIDQSPCKDEESPAEYQPGGYLEVQVSDSFSNGRYKVVRKLGWGHFSTVWLVKDVKTNRHSALKVVKSAGRYAETARDEIKLLSQVAAAAPSHPGREHIVSFLDSFTHHSPQSSHICIVFEPLGENLLGLIERNRKNGVPAVLVKIIAKQVLLGLQYLHDECDLVHTDIKPENILISIPDVEAHIYNELTHSPSPTSRRFGVPLPTKTRAGVTIPHSQQRPRRQVQIFESQPLGSPSSRSAGVAGASSSSSLGGSFAQPSPLSRLPTRTENHSGTPSSLSSGSNPASGISLSAPQLESQPNSHPKTAVGLLRATSHTTKTLSPSTSSSSSSLSSTMTSSQTLSSSAVSTPPTSFSHSLGSAVIGLMKMSVTGESKPPTQTPAKVAATPINIKGKGKSAQNEIEPLHSHPPSLNPSSWKNRYNKSLASSPQDLSHKSKRQSLSGHSRSGSGVSGSWKDPGVSAPAPAVIVSAVAQPHSKDGDPDHFDFSNVSVPTASSVIGNDTSEHSQSSSGTVKESKPSPLEAHLSPPSGTTSPLGPVPLKANGVSQTDVKTPSLLSQTAPIQILPAPDSPPSHHNDRSSPHQLVSQLSAAHILTQPPPDYVTPRSEKPGPFSTMSPEAPLSGLTQSPGSLTPSSMPSPSPSSLTLSRPATLDSVEPSAPGKVDVPHPPAKPHLPLLNTPVPPPPPIFVKIADLGNATPSRKHFTEDIQTRQYRAPEAILGRKDWDTRADVWSVACVVFELVAAEYLFDPQGQSGLFTKDDDHMAQIIELLGDFPLEVKMGGKYSRDLFDQTGALRYIKTLKPWSLKEVMTQKYWWSDRDASELCSFLQPMLAVDMRNRARARDMIDHPWLNVDPSMGAGLW